MSAHKHHGAETVQREIETLALYAQCRFIESVAGLVQVAP